MCSHGWPHILEVNLGHYFEKPRCGDLSSISRASSSREWDNSPIRGVDHLSFFINPAGSLSMHFSTDLNAPIYVSGIKYILWEDHTKTGVTMESSTATASIQAHHSSRSSHSAHCVWLTLELRVQELKD